MFFKLTNRAVSIYKDIVTSIGFVPTVISSGMGITALALLVIDFDKATTWLLEAAPILVIKDGDTARAILVTIAGGLVSLTVFSFTMVMAQLNRAADSYSPRLLPGLISTRSHQVVLGIFLGTITFSLIVLISIEPSDDSYELPGMTILIAVILGLSCLGLFVYFIHKISIAIQITNILERVSNKTGDRIKQIDAEREERHVGAPTDAAFEEAQTLRAPRTGYYHGCNISSLLEVATDEELVVEVVPVRGLFVLEGTVAVRLDREIGEEVEEKILSTLRFSRDDLVDDNFVLGFKQITEIAIRAMSPGINDPGTAVNAIDHLTKLFGLRMRLDDHEEYPDDEGAIRLKLSVIDFPELLYMTCAPLRQYCKHDVIVVLKLLQMFDYMLQAPTELESHREAIAKELDTLMTDAEAAIENQTDLDTVREFAERIGEKRHGEILSKGFREG